MNALLVVDDPRAFDLDLAGVETVSARSYLTDPAFTNRKSTAVYNLCRSYSYQKLGYYVSLIADARGHRPRPDVQTVRDLQSQVLTRVVGDELAHLVQKTLASLKSPQFVLSIYFGKPIAARDQRLATALSEQFRAPLLRARFSRKDDTWRLDHVGPIPLSEIPEDHMDLVRDAARAWFSKAPRRSKPKRPARGHLAILVDPTEPNPPSDEKALVRFEKAATTLSLGVERITKGDFSRLNEFDALLLRATTAVNHFTYRFARRAEAEGLIVIDDSRSIQLCTNKVYLAEVLAHHGVPTPKTLIVHRDNRGEVADSLGLPCVLKQPDSAFSVGVTKAANRDDLEQKLDQLLAKSELVIAQEFLPTDFDWRIGVFNGKPLYACRYHMARAHWQIMKHDGGDTTFGAVDCIPVENAPGAIVRAALRAAKPIGNGLYGVDLKQIGAKAVVIEVNDNPSLDADFEDRHLGLDLYETILSGMLQRLDDKRSAH